MDILEKAQQKIVALQSAVSALRAQRESIDAQLLRQERELGKLIAFIDTYRELDGGPIDTGPRVQGALAQVAAVLKPKNIEVIAEAYLRESAPKRTGEIVEYLESKGCHIPSDKKEAYLAGVLSRSKRFVARRKHGGWFLVENDPVVENLFECLDNDQGDWAIENAHPQSETPSVGAEGVSDTSTQAAVIGGFDSDDLV